MKWTTWLLFGLALTLCAALFAMAGRRDARSPSEFFAALEARIEAKQIDDDVALSELDLALRQAEESGNHALMDDVRLLRGKILSRIGSWERAKADLQIVNEHRGAPIAIDLLLSDVETRSGDLRAAQTRVRTRVTRDATDLEAWKQLGLLHAQSCTQALEGALAITRRTLIPTDAESAKTICARLCALDRSDPARVAWSHRLRTLYGTDRGVELEATLGRCDEGSEDARAALDALGHLLRARADPQCLTALFGLLRDAGHAETIADVAAAAVRVPDVRNDVACSTLILDTLLELERMRFAAQLSIQWLSRASPAPVMFFAAVCRALYATANWNHLGRAASLMYAVSDTAQHPWTDFYLGIARVHQPALGRDQTIQGRIDLVTRFLNSTAIDPLPGARAIAWREAASASRILGDVAAEREQLRGALDLEPESDGELWLRLVELSRDNPNASVRDQETQWARGMSLLPARTQELLPKWIELGELELRAAGIDPIVERTEQTSRGVWTTPPGASPYELYRLGRVHFEANDMPRAALCAEMLLRNVPGFLPAIDLAAACAQREGRKSDLVELVIQRMRAAGGDESSRALLRGIAVGDLASNELLDLMRGDPAGFGRTLIARTLHEHGDARGALKLLESMDASARSPEVREFAARLALEIGEPARALGYLDGAEAGAKTSRGDSSLYLLAALRTGDETRLKAIVEELVAHGELRKERWLTLADQLLAAGRPALARSLLERLDESVETRGGDVVLRLAQCTVITRDTAADGYLDRAQAFETEFGYEVLRLAQAADTQRWEDVERWATALTESHLRVTPLQRALLALLGGHPDTALERIQAGLEKEPRSPTWRLAEAIAASLAERRWEPPPYFGATILAETERFLVGTEKRGDARFTATLLFASTMASGAGWTRARVEAFPKRARGTLWRDYLLGQQARDDANVALARELFGELVTLHPGFGPGWDALERTPFSIDAPATALIDLREKRAAALGNLAGTPADRALDRARSAFSRREWDAALEAAKQAAELAPDKPTAFHLQSQILAARGDLGAALEAQRKGLELGGKRVDPREVERELELLSRAQAAQPPLVTREEVDREVGKLARAHPDDPRVVVAAARVDLHSDPDNAPIGVARALARLQGFRSRHETVALDRLAPGSLAPWAALLSEIDPERAATMLDRERALEPGNPDVWLLAARAAALQGHVEEAIRDLSTLNALVPSSGAARERLRWMTRRESRPEVLAKAVDDVLIAEGLADSDAELVLLRAEGQWVLGPRNSEAVLGLLAPIEKQALEPVELEMRRDWLVALAAICRNQNETIAHANEALDRLGPRVRDPHQRAAVAALRGIAHGAGAARAAGPE